MKIIFLDFDGVIVTLESMFSRRFEGKLKEGGISHDPLSYLAVHFLNDIIEETGAKVVVSSVWRMGNTEQELQNILNKAGFKGEVIGRTPIRHIERGLEIQEWMDNHADLNIESFVILDDDSDMKHLMKYLVNTDSEFGLRYEHKIQAIKILNNPTWWFLTRQYIKHHLRRSKYFLYSFFSWRAKRMIENVIKKFFKKKGKRL